jgi:phosphate transport system substrate-binding protein
MSTAISGRARRVGRGAMVAAMAALLSIPATVLLQSASPAPAGASPTVLGSGSSYAAVALDQWTAQMASFYGDNINYQTTSSVLGLNQYAEGQLNFAASEIGYSTGQSAYTPAPPYAPYQYLPDVAGATCLMYNLPNQITGAPITNLDLDEPVLLKIFTGQISDWNDPAIAALNPGVSLPVNTPIIKAYRSDASGENYIFSDYFYTLDPTSWNAFTTAMGTPSGPQAIFPTPSDGQGGPHGPGGIYDISGFEGENGSDVASEYVNDNPDSITYVETAYALRLHRPCVNLLNPAGDFVAPSEEADAVALTQDELEPDLEQILTGVFTNPDPASYPISAYSYLITQEDGQPSAAIGAVLGQFVQFIACRGQQSAGILGYSPLPPNLVDDDFAAVNRINGAAPLPAPTAANCPNPYLTGQLTLPGEPIQIGGGGASTTGVTTATASGGIAGGSAGLSTSAVTSGSGSGAQGAGATTTTSPTQTAAVAAAAAAASRVASALKKQRAPTAQPIGLAELTAVDHLLRLSGPTGQMLSWVLAFLLLFVALPLVLATAGWRRRRRLEAADVGRNIQ